MTKKPTTATIPQTKTRLSFWRMLSTARWRTKIPTPMRAEVRAALPVFRIVCMLNAKVSDRSQPPLMCHLSLSEAAGSGSLHRLVGLSVCGTCQSTSVDHPLSQHHSLLSSDGSYHPPQFGEPLRRYGQGANQLADRSRSPTDNSQACVLC